MTILGKDYSGVSSLISQRDAGSLAQLLEKYRPLLREMARSVDDPMLRSKVDRSDLVQQTCLDVVRGFEQLRATNRLQFVAWLRRIFKNNLHAARRRYLISKKRDVYSEKPLTCSSRIDRSIDDSSQLDDVLNMERVERLRASMQKLPPPLQTLLKWRYEDGLTLVEIATRTERSEDAVRMLIKRCLTGLRREIFDDDSRR